MNREKIKRIQVVNQDSGLAPLVILLLSIKAPIAHQHTKAHIQLNSKVIL